LDPNLISNREYCISFSQTGGGFSSYKPPFGVRINYYSRDDQPGKYVFLKDNQTGEYWSINWQPVKTDYEDYKCTFGLGYASIFSRRCGIEAQLHIFIPLKDPLEIWTISLKNTSQYLRDISFFTFVEWMLVRRLTTVDNYIWFSQAYFLPKEKTIFARMDDPNIHGWRYQAFLAGDFSIDSFDCSRLEFLGPNGTLSSPQAVKRGVCSDSFAKNEEYVGVLHHRCQLKKSENKNFQVILGYLNREEELQKYLRKYRKRAVVKDELKQVKQFWQKVVEENTIETPDDNLNRTANIWLKYQVAQVAWWARSGGAGYDSGYKGYRDMLQDTMGLQMFDPGYTKSSLLEAMRYQYQNGDAPRGWGGRDGEHNLRQYADSAVWIIFTLTSYLKETGDLKILKEQMQFLDSKEKKTVYQHALLALNFLWRKRGKHGLPLMREGDWNDCLDDTGRGGRGESVWLAMALHLALKQMAELASYLHDLATAKTCNSRVKELKEAINKHGWDGQWYLRAYNDKGEKLGSQECDEGKIYLMAQAWAIISGIADEEKSKSIFSAIDKWLKTPFGYKWCAPPYSDYRPGIGKLTVVHPKHLVYLHPNAFKILADCIAGRGNEAYQTLVDISSFNPKHLPDSSANEPHVFPTGYSADSDSHQYGQSQYGWMTGTAAWLLTIIFGGMLGVRAEYKGLRIDPCIPSGWRRCSIRKTFGRAIYQVSIKNPHGVQKGVKEIFVDGKKIKGNLINNFADGRLHRVQVIMGT